jgi:biopolymer transport protein ExbD
MAGGGSSKGSNPLSINLTPMIDCTMLLVVFFLLTTQMASSDFINMKLPKPTGSIASDFMEGNRAVINVVPYADWELKADPRLTEDMVKEFRLGTEHYSPQQLFAIVDKLQKARKLSSKPKDFGVEIRCDMRIDYSQAEPVFQVLQQAKIQKVKITALRATGGGGGGSSGPR